MKNPVEISKFLGKLMGSKYGDLFDANMEEFTYYIRMAALADETVTDQEMRLRLKKLAEGVVAASVKSFLDDKYTNDKGDVEINVGDNGVFDKDMHPIPEVDQIRKVQHEMVNVLVARGMYEFAKGRHLATVVKKAKVATAQYNAQRKKGAEDLEIEVMRLERKLPDIGGDDAARLSELYSSLHRLAEAKR
jgi:hypothetical protein